MMWGLYGSPQNQKYNFMGNQLCHIRMCSSVIKSNGDASFVVNVSPVLPLMEQRLIRIVSCPKDI